MFWVRSGAPDGCTPKGFRVCPLDALVIRNPQAAGCVASTGIRSFERRALEDAPHAETTSATPAVAAITAHRLTWAQSVRHHRTEMLDTARPLPFVWRDSGTVAWCSGM